MVQEDEMTNNTLNMDPPKKHFKTILLGYIYPVLPLLGAVVLSGLILIHILRIGVALTITDKILYVVLILIASVIILAGIFARTTTGIRIVAKLINGREDQIINARHQVYFRVFEFLLVFGIFTSILLFSIDTKIAAYNLDAARYFDDTPSYLRTASYSLFDSSFWAGERPFTIPLFYKIVGYTIQNYTDQGKMEQVGRIQLIFSLATWTLLGISVTLLMKKWIFRYLSFAVLIMVGASLNITMLDRLMLSDSFSISFFVLFLSFVIFGATLWRLKSTLTVWLRILFVICFVVVAALFSFTRDPNAWFLLSLGGLMLLGFLFRSIRKHKSLVEFILIMSSFFVIFGVQNSTLNKTSRYVLPLENVIFYRFIPDNERNTYLLTYGMPYNPHFITYYKLSIKESQDQLLIDDPANHLSTWIKTQGKQVLFTYLITHPNYTFVSLLATFKLW
jgi:hypothetical protein